MGPSNSILLVLSSCFLFFLVVARKEITLEKSEDDIQATAHHYQTVELSSFLSSSTCRQSIIGDTKKGYLEVVHKHGPCSKFTKDTVKPLTVEEIFTNDQSRVDSIRSRLAIKTGKKDVQGSKTTLPAKSGTTIGSANYIVTIGLGTPKEDLSLIFDTGSDITWTQCQPCAGECYKQQDPIFAPSSSTTYSNISCSATECLNTGRAPQCFSSTCGYRIQYGDGSITTGFLAKEKVTLASDVIDGFLFGCGQYNKGLFRGDAGLLGLGRGKLSIVTQAAEKYGKVFSYCLPSTASSTGYLTFGSSGIDSSVAYTPLSDSPGPSFYGLDLEAIYVGGNKLEISPTVFTTSGMIIDSGTVITRLPPTAYSALRTAFRAKMTQYPLTKGFSIFDTCYDLSKYSTITIPTLSFVWGGNTKVDIVPQGILFPLSVNQVCLAFAGNRDDSGIGIFGNTQQKTLEVVHDVTAGKVGFAPGKCA
ncbi:hypothetical protein L2E82_22603 [Cichorium intybus]|uniref:Uncharacterized protein n=1 Tax=Cichorium intybus TaxID=13427 RepID=A0ACB9DY81_CICIN|nr:hypothetical protein L2E82_22603 [Cichorium intybus]